MTDKHEQFPLFDEMDAANQPLAGIIALLVQVKDFGYAGAHMDAMSLLEQVIELLEQKDRLFATTLRAMRDADTHYRDLLTDVTAVTRRMQEIEQAMGRESLGVKELGNLVDEHSADLQ